MATPYGRCRHATPQVASDGALEVAWVNLLTLRAEPTQALRLSAAAVWKGLCVLSLSTSCFGNPAMTTPELLAAVRRMGFQAIEYAVSPVKLDADVVAEAVAAGEITVTSVHALAGLSDPTGVKMNHQGGDLGSPDDRKRFATIDAMCRTVDLARRLGARAVVVHCGGIEGRTMDRCVDLMRNWSMWRTSPMLAQALEDLHVMRRREVEPFVERTIASLDAVLQRVGDFPLGLETRFVYCQVPLPDELERIWRKVGRDCLYYWHDVGHARIEQLFGAVPEMSWLDRFGDRLLGVHLHDMVGARDHQVPGTGELDLAEVSRRLAGRDCVRVLELNASYVPEAIIAGRKHLESLGL